MKATIFLLTIFLFSILSLSSQNLISVSGTLKGAGNGKKIYLGNKPSGIGQGFIHKYYDSTEIKNDSFHFNPMKYVGGAYLSLEVDSILGWASFKSDTGKIFISANIDTLFRSRISGSGNQEIIKKFFTELYYPWKTEYSEFQKRLLYAKSDTFMHQSILDSLNNFMDVYRNKIYKFYEENVRSKPYAAFDVLEYASLKRLPDSLFLHYFSMIPKNVRNSDYFEKVSYTYTGFKKNIIAGRKLPLFKFYTPENKINIISNSKSQYKLLVFWASWCAPCLAEIPLLDSIYQLDKNLGLQVFCINVDNSLSLWKTNLYRYNPDFHHLYQGSYSISPIYKYFNIQSIPFLILLDSNNKIIKYNISLKEVNFYIK